MKLSTSHVIMYRRPDGICYTTKESFDAVKAAGYDRVDVSLWDLCKPDCPLAGDDWQAAAEKLAAEKDAAGLPVYQTHGPVMGGSEWDDPAYPHAWYRETVMRSIEASRQLGASWMVLHPYNISRIPLYDRAANREANLRFFAPFIEEAKKRGVGIAIENMVDFGRRHRRYCGGDVYELIELVDTINDPAVGICFDTGHGNISGMDVGAAIRAIGKRLVATHINDNHAGSAADEHLLPYFGTIDWADVMAALREIGYVGDFAYEIGSQHIPAEAREAWLAYTVAIGRKLLAM